MSNPFEEFDEAPVTPTLSFGEPEKKEEEAERKLLIEQEAETGLDDSMLNEEERKMVEEFSKKIDLHNSSAILQYGAGTQKKMADFSEKALDNVKTKDLGEVGTMITGLVTELQGFEIEEEERGFLGLFKKQANKVTALKAKYEKAEGLSLIHI